MEKELNGGAKTRPSFINTHNKTNTRDPHPWPSSGTVLPCKDEDMKYGKFGHLERQEMSKNSSHFSIISRDQTKGRVGTRNSDSVNISRKGVGPILYQQEAANFGQQRK